MKKLALAVLLLASGAGASGAESTVQPGDALILADRTVRTGTVLSLDATDLMFQGKERSSLRLIPLAEVREIRFGNGDVRLFQPIEDPNLDSLAAEDAAFRSSPYVRAEDLVLSRREVLLNALPRGILVGTVATLFTTDGDAKKAAFAAGFLVQFGISVAIGW
ncbi:MAG: hypothetical protein EHM19_05555 [Candidatus Latescibacterota bacterium]|nr:MAG: hypothetical protein EHM19_05555 [Candidatus Latescibacterota bacterium]